MNTLDKKYETLKSEIKALGRTAVAFSGGVDSAFLLKICRDVLGDNVLAVTLHLNSSPRRESEETISFCREYNIRQVMCDFNQLEIPGFCQNPPDRCYICKKVMFGKMRSIAEEHGIENLIEGSNCDDLGDYRPGMAAVKELGIISPLISAGFTKTDIRKLSREMGIPTWDKPSLACLSSRFEYGEVITAEKLNTVDQAEQMLLQLGLKQVRVRVHNDIARIEVMPEQFDIIISNAVAIDAYMKGLGFSYVTLDITGYRTGSMNAQL